jgi:LPXTG-site transpeptidase (sortase) family protein
MIRKNPKNNNSNDHIDFDYYIPESIKNSSDFSFAHKEEQKKDDKKDAPPQPQIKNNTHSLNDIYDDLHGTKKYTKKKSNYSLISLKPKKIIKILFVILVGLLGVYFLLNAPLYYYRFFHLKKVANQNQVNPSDSAEKNTATLEKKVAPTTESRLIVPKIGVDAPIIFAETTIEKDIQEALREGVVHYFKTAKPGEDGNIFISGHSSNYWWEKGNYNYVFSLLDRMDVGDTATIYYKGHIYEYTVYEKFIVNPTEVSVLAQTQKPILTLMTCTPPGTDFRRLIVRLDQTYPAKNEPKNESSNSSVQENNSNNSDGQNSGLPKDKKSLIEYFNEFFSILMGKSS